MTVVAGIDHAGIVVPDLAAAARHFEQLGFNLTGRADHTRPGPDGAPVSSGSSQHSIMFGRGYLEIMQVTDPAAGHMLTGAAERYPGIHILALATADAASTHRAMAQRGVTAETPEVWRRPVSEGAMQGMAEFNFFGIPPRETPEGYVIATEHRTPHLLRPPDKLDHPNTAIALAEVLLCTTVPDETLARYYRYTGCQGERVASGAWRLDLAGQTIRVCTPEWLAHTYAGARPPAPTAFVGVTLTVEQLGVAASLPSWRERAVTTERGLSLNLQASLGLILELRSSAV